MSRPLPHPVSASHPVGAPHPSSTHRSPHLARRWSTLRDWRTRRSRAATRREAPALFQRTGHRSGERALLRASAVSALTTQPRAHENGALTKPLSVARLTLERTAQAAPPADGDAFGPERSTRAQLSVEVDGSSRTTSRFHTQRKIRLKPSSVWSPSSFHVGFTAASRLGWRRYAAPMSMKGALCR